MIKLIKSTFFEESKTKKKLASFVLKATTLSMHEHCAAFEKAFAKKQGRKYAIFVNSGSSANLILLQALLNKGLLRRGDRVGFSALTWATNVMPIIQLGLVPIPVDCSRETLNISPQTLDGALHGMKALFLTNVLGLADDLPRITELCRAKKVILLEDNCEALGSKIGRTMLGNFGLAATFSFYVGHHLSTIEGGMVVTDDQALASELCMTRAHGWDRNLPPKEAKKIQKNSNDFFSLYTFYDLAYNVRPTEIQGFLGCTQLPYWATIVAKREHNFCAFQKAARENADFLPVKTDHMCVVSNFAFPVICKSPEIFSKYLKRFKKANVEVRPIIAGNITQQPFYRKYNAATGSNPNAEYIHNCGFYFGNNPELTGKEVATLCGLLSS